MRQILGEAPGNILSLLRHGRRYAIFYCAETTNYAITLPKTRPANPARPNGSPRPPVARALPPLDRTDVRILDTLQVDARTSHQELSEKVHLSAPQCFRRVRKLEESGVIARYVALLDPARVGLGVTAFVSVSLKSGQKQDLEKFKSVVAAIPEILECHTVTGEADYLLKVVAPDLQVFSRFLLERLVEHFDVVSTKSEVSLEQIKFTTVLPLSARG